MSIHNVQEAIFAVEAFIEQDAFGVAKNGPSQKMTGSRHRVFFHSRFTNPAGQIGTPDIIDPSHRVRKKGIGKMMLRLICCAIDAMLLRGPESAIVSSWGNSINRNPIMRRHFRRRYGAMRIAAHIQPQAGKAVRDVP